MVVIPDILSWVINFECFNSTPERYCLSEKDHQGSCRLFAIIVVISNTEKQRGKKAKGNSWVYWKKFNICRTYPTFFCSCQFTQTYHSFVYGFSLNIFWHNKTRHIKLLLITLTVLALNSILRRGNTPCFQNAKLK